MYYDDFDQSFKGHTDLFSQTLTISDIKYYNVWLFSIRLVDVIESNRLLRERITLDSSGFIQETNGIITSNIYNNVRRLDWIYKYFKHPLLLHVWTDFWICLWFELEYRKL